MYVRTHITEIKQNRNETLYTLDNDIYNRRPGSKKTNKKDKKKKKNIKSRVVKLNEFTIDSHSSLFSAFSCTDSTTRR